MVTLLGQFIAQFRIWKSSRLSLLYTDYSSMDACCCCCCCCCWWCGSCLIIWLLGYCTLSSCSTITSFFLSLETDIANCCWSSNSWKRWGRVSHQLTRGYLSNWFLCHNHANGIRQSLTASRCVLVNQINLLGRLPYSLCWEDLSCFSP